MTDAAIEAARKAIEAENASLDEAEAKGNFLVPEFRSLALARAAVIAYVEHAPVTEQMIEQAARAIARGHAHGEADLRWHPEGGDHPKARPLWQWHVDEAGAIIEAMRSSELDSLRRG